MVVPGSSSSGSARGGSSVVDVPSAISTEAVETDHEPATTSEVAASVQQSAESVQQQDSYASEDTAAESRKTVSKKTVPPQTDDDDLPEDDLDLCPEFIHMCEICNRTSVKLIAKSGTFGRHYMMRFKCATQGCGGEWHVPN